MRRAILKQMKLSPNFTINEFTRSKKADLLKIDNTKPTPLQIAAMKRLCLFLLEPLRAQLREKIHPKAVIVVTSGYRCPALNKEVGGTVTSGHPKGEAADIHVEDGSGNRIMTTKQLFDFILQSGLEYDQAISEFDNWVHISHRRMNRMQSLYAWHDSKKKVRYTTKPPYAFAVLKMDTPLT